jgi:hypothetical protein
MVAVARTDTGEVICEIAGESLAGARLPSAFLAMLGVGG